MSLPTTCYMWQALAADPPHTSFYVFVHQDGHHVQKVMDLCEINDIMQTPSVKRLSLHEHCVCGCGWGHNLWPSKPACDNVNMQLPDWSQNYALGLISLFDYDDRMSILPLCPFPPSSISSPLVPSSPSSPPSPPITPHHTDWVLLWWCQFAKG